MLKLQTYANGKVVNGTFSKRVNGVLHPTKEAVYLLTEAFELDNLTEPYAKFSTETREILAEKYGVSEHLMILSTRDLGVRINHEDDIIRIGRDLAFAYYTSLKRTKELIQ